MAGSEGVAGAGGAEILGPLGGFGGAGGFGGIEAAPLGPSGGPPPFQERPERKLPPGLTAPGPGVTTPAQTPPAQVTPAPEAQRTPARPPRERPSSVIKTILGLVFLLALAYLGGHPRVQQLERRLGIAQVVTAGFPFVALGILARSPAVGLLTDELLVQLSPLLHLGLGWIGFMIGFRFDARLLDQLPEGTAPKVAFSTGVPFLTIVLASGLLLFVSTGWEHVTFRDPIFLRDAMILGSAGAITGRAAARLIGKSEEAATRILRIIRLEELAGIAGLTFLAAYFRPQGDVVSWHLPGTAWIFITLGLGATVGLVAYAILRRQVTQNESLVLLLGTVAFAAGLASNLLLSPIVVCFVAGVLLVNFPGDYKERVARTLAQLERPIYLLFLVIVGAIWNVTDWRGWALMVVFLLARWIGKWVGANLGWRNDELALDRRERFALATAPMGQLSIAIVVSSLLLYPGATVSFIVTAVIGGAVVTEVLLQFLVRRFRPRGEKGA